MGKVSDNLKSDISFTTLDAANIGPVTACSLCKLFLAPAALNAQLPDLKSKPFLRTCHGSMDAMTQILSLETMSIASQEINLQGIDLG